MKKVTKMKKMGRVVVGLRLETMVVVEVDCGGHVWGGVNEDDR